MDLYSKLFETFDSISKGDVEQGVVKGVVSPYSVPAKDAIGIALSTLEKESEKVNYSISRLHQKYRYNIQTASSSDLQGFKEFSSRLVKAMSLNKFMEEDPVMQEKLSQFLTYCYALLSKKQGYVIYPDVEQAKKVARIVFSKAKSLGLTFLPIEVEDLLKTILFTVFFKLPKEK